MNTFKYVDKLFYNQNQQNLIKDYIKEHQMKRGVTVKIKSVLISY